MANEFLKNAIFGRRQPGGATTYADERYTNKDIVYVSSVTGTDADGYGRHPESPCATLDYAISLNSNPKPIILLPNHAETLVGATSCVLDVAGTEVWGRGTGTERATFTLGTATAATISITAANCQLHNIKVISDLADVAAGVTAAAGADGLLIEDCWFADGAAAKELVIGVSCAADCDNVTIRNNWFTTANGGGCASAIKFVGATDNSRVERNFIFGDYSAAGIDGATAAGTLILLLDNWIHNHDATAGLAISMNSSTSGIVSGNHCHGGKDGTAPLAVAGMDPYENYGTNAEGASGIILPAVDS